MELGVAQAMDNPALGRPEGGQPDAIVKGSGVDYFPPA